MSTTDFIAAIELSSSRIAGIAGKRQNDGSTEVLAYACEDSSAFVRKGQVYNIDKAAHAIQNIVTELEKQLGTTVAKVYAGIAGQSLRTVENRVSHTLEEEDIISAGLVDQLCDENRDLPLADMCVLDVAPQEYKIDNALHTDPVGVAGRNITARFLNIIARHQLRKNLEQAFEKAGVKVADMLVAPLAMAHAVLTESEMRAGCALVDLGAGTTTVQVYKNNILRYLCVLPLGGNNITHDLTSLKIEEGEAENLKLHYGNAICTDDDDDDEASVPCRLNDGRDVKLHELNDIVGARAEEIMSNAWNQIQLSGYENELFAGVVLTGGGSCLPGTETLFRNVSRTDKVRTARFVRESLHGHEEELGQDARLNTLLGLLLAGRDNCARPSSTSRPAQASIFTQEEMKPDTPPTPAQTVETPHTETTHKTEENEKPVQDTSKTPEKEQEKEDKGKNKNHGKDKKKSSPFGKIIDLFRDGMLDESDSIKN